VVGAIAVATLAGGFLLGRQTAPEPVKRVMRFVLPAPDSVLTYGRCCGNELALSPDGATLVFVGSQRNGAGPLYRRSLDRLEAEPIPGTEGGATPFFSPDGRWVGFLSDGRLRKVSLAGGPPIPIVAVTGNLGEATWGPGDVILYSNQGRLFTVSASGGEPRSLTAVDSSRAIYAPSFLPDGKAALVTVRDRGADNGTARMAVVDLATGKLDTLGLGIRPRYANGYLVYAGADNSLLAQPFDPKGRKLTGQSVAILDRLALHGATTVEFALSTEGGLAYEPQAGSMIGETFRLRMGAGDSSLSLPGHVGDNLEDPSFGPDGNRVAMRLVPTGGTPDLWVLNRRQGTLDRLTVGGGSFPAWSRDGRRIAYLTASQGLFVKAADGTGEPRLILKGTQLSPGSWLPGDTALVFYVGNRPTTLEDIGLIRLGDTVPRWLLATEFRERHPQLSPNGRWLAYSSDRTGQFEVYVKALVGNGPSVQVSTGGGHSPRWSPDGRTLYFANGPTAIMAAAVNGAGLEFMVGERKTLAQNLVMDLNNPNVNWDIHPNGKEFLYIDEGGGSGTANRLIWVLNFPELVKSMATGR
jgi:serine/threonine-protein kinase